MLKRKLGKTGLEIAPLVFGGSVLGWTVDEATSFAILDAFIDLGFNCIDTADGYSIWVTGHKGGESETIIGNWLKSRQNRNKIVLATKVGWELDADRKGLSKAYIVRAVEDSLRRLQTDYIDLYQSHIDDSNTAFEETLSAYGQLIEQGKIRAFGASNYSAARLRTALDTSDRYGLPRYQTLQPHYNLCERREFEGPLATLCAQEKLGVLSYAALASGFLTGKYRSEGDLSKGVRGVYVKGYCSERGFRILSALDKISRRRNVTLSQISLAWLLSRPGIAAPIAAATSVAQLKEIALAPHLELNRKEIALLDSASSDVAEPAFWPSLMGRLKGAMRFGQST